MDKKSIMIIIILILMAVGGYLYVSKGLKDEVTPMDEIGGGWGE